MSTDSAFIIWTVDENSTLFSCTEWYDSLEDMFRFYQLQDDIDGYGTSIDYNLNLCNPNMKLMCILDEDCTNLEYLKEKYPEEFV